MSCRRATGRAFIKFMHPSIRLLHIEVSTQQYKLQQLVSINLNIAAAGLLMTAARHDSFKSAPGAAAATNKLPLYTATIASARLR
jgi:hypothetical protein